MSKTREDLQHLADGRYFTVVDYSVKGKYPRVYLKTKDQRVARRRLAVLDGIDDTDEAKLRITHLAEAVDEQDAQRRIAEFLAVPKFTSIVDRTQAAETLRSAWGSFIEWKTSWIECAAGSGQKEWIDNLAKWKANIPQLTFTDEMMDQWIAADDWSTYCGLLAGWGFSNEWLTYESGVSARRKTGWDRLCCDRGIAGRDLRGGLSGGRCGISVN